MPFVVISCQPYLICVSFWSARVSHATVTAWREGVPGPSAPASLRSTPRPQGCADGSIYCVEVRHRASRAWSVALVTHTSSDCWEDSDIGSL